MPDDDFFAIYGTEFEELEEEEKGSISRKPAGIQDQIVTDENGRRRFHGAFTGGFSAGYYNTVGSKEGWTPQEFKSSRDQRAAKFQQRAEDLMDEEDLGEFGIGARRIRTAEKFSSGKSAEKRLAWEHDVTTSSGVSIAQQLENVIRPVSDSIGKRMLRAMGWREGRGVGLVTSKSKQQVSNFDAEQIRAAAPDGFNTAAEDVLMTRLRSVETIHGLGYEAMSASSVLDERYGRRASAFKTHAKSKGIRGQAFGVGAFEDEDENIYSNYDLDQFDFALDAPGTSEEGSSGVDSTFVLSNKRLNPRKFYPPPKLPPNFRPAHRPKALEQAKLPGALQDAMKTLTAIQRAKLLGEDRVSVMELVSDKDRKRLERHRSRWDQRERSDDRGEESRSKRLNPRKFYPPPKLPPNFRPAHRPKALEQAKLPGALQDAMKTLTAIQRAKLLGEDRVSVMELVSDKDRKRLERHRSRWDQRERSDDRGEESRSKDRVEFPDEPMKQARFKEFLKYLRRGLVLPQPKELSVWEWESERKEFEKRLTAEERGMLPEVRARAQPLAKSSLAMPIQELLQNKFTKETGASGHSAKSDSDKMAAVKMGMFGERTRTTFQWYPDNVLAKRFNIPNPYPGAGIVGVPHLQKSTKKETLLNLGLPQTASELAHRRAREVEHHEEKELEEKEREPPEEELDRPPQSIFDVIFGESDSDTDSTITGFSVLKYLKEEIDRRKKEKKRDHHKKHKSKKSKKEKSKKSRKEKKSKKSHHHRHRSSSSSSSGVVDILKWIPVMMIAMTVTFTVLTCVVPRETKYKSGVSVRKKDDDDPQQRRKGVYAIFQNIGNLMRGTKSRRTLLPSELLWRISDRRASESARITGSNDPIEVETDSAPDRPSSSVRAMAGSLRFRGRRDNRRSGEYREVPLEPPPCLAFKYGAPDGVRKPQLPAIFETPEASFADASYGATYKLPGPAVIGVNEDC
ncbi:hypothetical protein ANCCEY_00841 [Ancylostoma ceylanicum]|uniref:G-patch domain-containing protein n=1 Tax=Ancylostoma ceylanicum TaxID=53326 RepID=A0A0D6M958_9BILA|nr:hypothetical protein ANCCEY_00841 [Ancylostoma ceylanicum]